MKKNLVWSTAVVFLILGSGFSASAQEPSLPLHFNTGERKIIVNPQPDANGRLFFPPFSTVILSNTSYQLKAIEFVDGTEVIIKNTEIVLDSSFDGEAYLRGRNMAKFVMENSSIISPRARSTFFLDQPGVVSIHHSHLEGFGYTDDQGGNVQAQGIVIQGNPKLTFTHNKVKRSAAVVFIGNELRPMEYPVVEDNRILDMDYNGFVIRRVERGSFADNVINDVEYHRAFMVMSTNNTSFFSNTCGDEDTQTALFPGGGCLLLGNSHHNTFNYNTIYGGKHGIGVTGTSTGTHIRGNTIMNVGEGFPPLPYEEMSAGISIMEQATDTKIGGNTLRDNYVGIRLFSGQGSRIVRNNLMNFSDETQTRYNMVIGHLGEKGPFNQNFWGRSTCEEAKQTVVDPNGRQTSVFLDSIFLQPYEETKPRPDILKCS